MTGMNTTRGVPFKPAAAQAQRDQAAMRAAELERQEREEAREQHKEAMRAHGRMLDEMARKERRKRKQEEKRRRQDEIDQCYRERRQS